MELELDRVEVTLGRTNALRGVTLGIGPGVTALVGRNGAGKTTLIRAAVGAIRPRSGRVLRGGVDIGSDARTLRHHRRHLGWLPQEPGFPGRMRVLDFLRYAAWLKDLPAGEQDAAAIDALDHGDLHDHAGRRIGALSGGQRRRTALAAALVGKPSLVVLDEPTNGLDPVQRARLLALVRSVAADTTVLLATHLLEDVGQVADRWLALDEGRVVDTGTLDHRSAASVADSLASIRAALTRDSRPNASSADNERRR